MELKTPDNIKEVVEITYTWNAGMSMELIVDESQGDSVTDGGTYLHIHLAPKPVLSNPELTAGEEDIMIFKSTLASIVTRKRTLRLPTADEVFDLQQILHPMPKQVQ